MGCGRKCYPGVRSLFSQLCPPTLLTCAWPIVPALITSVYLPTAETPATQLQSHQRSRTFTSDLGGAIHREAVTSCAAWELAELSVQAVAPAFSVSWKFLWVSRTSTQKEERLWARARADWKLHLPVPDLDPETTCRGPRSPSWGAAAWAPGPGLRDAEEHLVGALSLSVALMPARWPAGQQQTCVSGLSAWRHALTFTQSIKHGGFLIVPWKTGAKCCTWPMSAQSHVRQEFWDT